ncbi:MAG: 4Fe-4S binding protein, partial [Anaerolineae bacterium]|nr:4Fe-4S binding protein [Anaerolineae bacterium]
IGCRNCAEACPFGAIFWDAAQNKPQICVYCGYCARYCPYEVLALEDLTSSPALRATPSPLLTEGQGEGEVGGRVEVRRLLCSPTIPFVGFST